MSSAKGTMGPAVRRVGREHADRDCALIFLGHETWLQVAKWNLTCISVLVRSVYSRGSGNAIDTFDCCLLPKWCFSASIQEISLNQS